METIIWLISAPLACMTVFLVAELALMRKYAPIRKDRFLKNIQGDRRYVVMMAAVRLCLLEVILSTVEITGEHLMQVQVIPVWASVLVSAIAAGDYLIGLNGGETARHFMKVFMISSTILLVLEVFIFNATSANDGISISEVNLYNAEIDGQAVHSEDGLVISDDTDIYIEGKEGQNTVVLHLKGEEYENRYHLVCSIEDDNFSENFVDVRDMYPSSGTTEIEVTLKPYGRIHKLALRFSDLPCDMVLTDVEFKNSGTYVFSAGRYFALLFIVCIVSLIFIFKLYDKVYTGTFNQELWLEIICAVCILTVIFFINMDTGFEKYPFDEDASGRNPYVQTFDAFMKGQVNLDIPVSEELLNMDNPYDVSARRAAEVSAAWDRAFYEGKYYSYFGLTPVFLVVAPVYILTGYVPGNGVMVFMFSIAAAVFLCLAISQIIKTYVKAPNLLLTYLLYPAAFAVSGIYLCLQYADQYYVAVACSMANIYMCLYFGFRAINTDRGIKQYGCLMLSGLGLAFSLGGRLTACFASLVLAPAFIGLLTDKESGFKTKIIQSVSFLMLPVIAIIGLLVYNKLRFGSFLDFGAQYQLTISDIQANRLHISYIFEAVWRYFLQLPAQKTAFPYVELSRLKVIDLGGYMYTDMCIGILCVPMILLGVSLMGKSQSRRICAANGGNVLSQRALHWVCLVVAVFLAWFDFCQGGVNMRYVMDLMPCMLLLSIISILRTTKRPGSTRYILALIACILSIILIWALMVSESGTVINRMHGALLDEITDLILFWK